MKIIPLSEGAFTVGTNKKFLPFDIATDKMGDREHGSLLVEVQPFLVITRDDLVIFDTGLGMMQEGEMQLVRNLANKGFQTGDITKVLMSHLHKDHSGGLRNSLTAQPTFPNATHYIQERELEFAYEKGGPSYTPEQLEQFVSSANIKLLQNDEGYIGNTIQYKLTGAHSKFHQVFWIKEGGETVFFGGDDAPQYQQMLHRFAAKYDYDGKKAMELRKEWWQQGEAEKWKFLFYHDVRTPVYPY